MAERRAIKWLTLSADHGDALAQYDLGMILKREEGTPQNDKNAVKCLTAAAEQGGVRAKTELGSMYDKGQCVPQNYETTIKRLTLAAVWASLVSDRDVSGYVPIV